MKYFKTYENTSNDLNNEQWELKGKGIEKPIQKSEQLEKTKISLDEINRFFQERNMRIDENRRIHLSVLCDSTYFFLVQMVDYLKAIGCTDIQTNGYQENDEIYGYRFEASGLLPKKFKVIKTEK